jgi:hypothetical protein
MGSVCGALNWTPAAFWHSTMHEIVAIIESREKE